MPYYYFPELTSGGKYLSVPTKLYLSSLKYSEAAFYDSESEGLRVQVRLLRNKSLS